MNEIWTSVDTYIEQTLLGDDPALQNAVRASEAAGLPAIQVSAAQGRLLFLLARMLRARNILEIGTLGGYSGICLARALRRGGRLVTLELEPAHAAVARANFAAAGVGELVDVRIGPATASLAALATEPDNSFDMVFIDADKPSTLEYFQQSMRLCHEGSLIVVDNVVRRGTLAEAGADDANALAMRQLHDWIATEPRIAATTIQMVGSKGYDGMLLAVVDGDRRTQ